MSGRSKKRELNRGGVTGAGDRLTGLGILRGVGVVNGGNLDTGGV